MIEFDSTTTRRLPVYLLLDTSVSMQGDAIAAVNQGIQLLLTELKDDPMALETAWISCITFDSTAKEILPLTEVSQAEIPQLTAQGSRSMGAAVQMLLQKMNEELRRNSPEQKGDYEPLVFLMSDGPPTDPELLARVAPELRNRTAANVIALACGRGAVADTLKQVAAVVLLMEDMTPDNIRSFFKWVSQRSVRVGSRSTAVSPSGTDQHVVSLPKAPDGLQIAL